MPSGSRVMAATLNIKTIIIKYNSRCLLFRHEEENSTSSCENKMVITIELIDMMPAYDLSALQEQDHSPRKEIKEDHNTKVK